MKTVDDLVFYEWETRHKMVEGSFRISQDDFLDLFPTVNLVRLKHGNISKILRGTESLYSTIRAYYDAGNGSIFIHPAYAKRVGFKPSKFDKEDPVRFSVPVCDLGSISHVHGVGIVNKKSELINGVQHYDISVTQSNYVRCGMLMIPENCIEKII